MEFYTLINYLAIPLADRVLVVAVGFEPTPSTRIGKVLDERRPCDLLIFRETNQGRNCYKSKQTDHVLSKRNK